MKRPHVVLDTNVLVSALIFGGAPREVLGMIIAGAVHCSLSSAILDELRDVLQRPKFGFSSWQAASIVEEFCALCETVSPSMRVSIVSTDPDDDRVLECALEARADAIVSGDSHLLELGEYEGICILSPSQFLQIVTRNAPIARGRRRHKR